MPVYSSTQQVTIDGTTLNVGNNKVARYFDTSVWTMLTLVTDENLTPITEVFASTLPMPAQTGLSEYSQLLLDNRSGDVVTVKVNDENSFTINAGVQITLDNTDRKIEKLRATGTGSSNFVLQGFKYD